MLTIGSPLLSSLTAQRDRMANAAHNVANLHTSGFRPLRTDLTERRGGGVDAVTTRAATPPSSPPAADVPGDLAPAADPPAHSVDLVHELSEMADAQRSYEVTAAALGRTFDTLGSLLDTFA